MSTLHGVKIIGSFLELIPVPQSQLAYFMYKVLQLAQ